MRLIVRPLLAVALWLVACLAQAAPEYQVEYRVGFEPAKGEARVAIVVTPGSGYLQRLRLRIDGERHHAFEGDGRIELGEDVVTWRPGKRGGTLRYRYRVDRIRSDGAFDARITADWALLRADRLVPPAAALAPGRAEAKATIRFELPKDWSLVETAHLRRPGTQVFDLATPGRRFQRPLGWMIAGALGARTEDLDGSKVSVAAPRGSAMRRNDVLAVVNSVWLPMRDAFGRVPPKLLIVGADDSMWRGGLSGPGSLYLHPDRPLISENGTSTLVHEMVHVAAGIRGERGDDWIAEGIAEFYSIELLRRSGLISESRAERAFAWMGNHGRNVKTLRADHSRGPRTARAVTLLHALDDEVRKASGGERGIDDVIRPLVGAGRISTAELRAAAAEALGRPSKALQAAVLPR